MLPTAVGEDDVEQAALQWLAELCGPVAHGPAISPPDDRTPGTERDSCRDVALRHRLADEDADMWGTWNQFQAYQQDIPDLFQANALQVISDGLQARMGSLTSNRGRFMAWRTIDGVATDPLGPMRELETLVRGPFERHAPGGPAPLRAVRRQRGLRPARQEGRRLPPV